MHLQTSVPDRIADQFNLLNKEHLCQDIQLYQPPVSCFPISILSEKALPKVLQFAQISIIVRALLVSRALHDHSLEPWRIDNWLTSFDHATAVMPAYDYVIYLR
jgi:hypothetical protein